MACQPTEMSSRNWMMRRMLIDAIRNDPDWNNGDYTTQPRALRTANAFFGVVSSGGTLAWQKAAPTREKADALLDARMAAPYTADANDVLYQWDSSRDYNAAPGLERIEAPLLLINSADDERNPPETGITDNALKRVRNAKLYLIPASEETRGHATTGIAKFYTRQLRDFLETVPRRTM
jgi:homoserine O-acetyltransferase/O-succinyltransferase